MTDENQNPDSPTIPANSQKPRKAGKKSTPIKDADRPTAKQGAGLNKISQADLKKWTVFVQEETKLAVTKAAVKAGLTVTDWLDSRLRETATGELTKKATPPAKPEDLVTDVVQKMADRLKADQEAATEAQSVLIREQGDQIAKLSQIIADRPASLKELLFGKPKPPAAE